MKLNSVATYACYDASIAIEAIYILKDKYNVSDDIIKLGLAKAYMPNRMEIVKSHPLVIIDGGHNPEAIDKLVKSISDKYIDKPIHIVFACFKDKNISSILPSLSLISNDITLTTFDHVRARSEEDYFLYLEEYKFDPDYKVVINNLLFSYPEDIILITGSLAFASRVRRLYKDE